jgi:7-cyano-7-deazaguanine synthase
MSRGEDAARTGGSGRRGGDGARYRMTAARAKAVLLLSGGLDSATCLLIAREEGYDVHALSFDYGQRHAVELDAARAIAAKYGASEHRVVRLDYPGSGASALTDLDVGVPRDALGLEAIPATYVPARNTLFLAHALAWAEVLGASAIFIGANALDYSGYPDCRPQFLEAFERAANLGTRRGVEGHPFRIHAPLLRSSKADIVRRAATLGLDFALTTSCYEPGPGREPCGRCDACLLREKGFREAGIADPLRAVNS